MVVEKFLRLANLAEAPVFYINKSTWIIIVDQYWDLILIAIQ